jgi:hypothetical protein
MRIQELQSQLTVKPKEKPIARKNRKKGGPGSNSKVSKSSIPKIDKSLTGFLVRCVIVGGPKGKVIEVAIDFETKFRFNTLREYPLPEAEKRLLEAKKRSPHNKKKTKKTKISSLRKGQTSEDRKSRLPSQKGSNIGRPWQG